MVKTRTEQLLDEEEQGSRLPEKTRKKGKMKKVFTADDEEDGEDEDSLDYFEIDGFIVDNVEDEDGDKEEEENPKQMQKKKKKRRNLENIVLDDDDLELIRENKNINQEELGDGKFKRLKKSGIDTELVEHSYDAEGSLFDDIFGDESDDADDDMADFIMDDEAVIHGKRDSLRQKKLKDLNHLSSSSKEAEYSFGKESPLEEHIRGVQFQSTKSDDPNKYESIIPTNMHVAGEGNSVNETDIPERMQIMEDIVGSAPVDRMSIEEESSWILSQVASNLNPLFSVVQSCKLLDTVKKEDVVRFLELHHTMKYDIPFIAMYRKELCLSLLEDPKQDESENIILDDFKGKPMLKLHKMLWIIMELDKKWLLLQKRKNMLMRYYKKHFEEQSQMSFLFEESRFHKQIFESVTNMLKKAETEGEIDDIDMKFNLHFPPTEGSFNDGYKRPKMKSYFSNCIKAGLWSLASKFGDHERFGSLVSLEKAGMDSEEDPEESPEEMASIYKCEMFQTSEAVLKGARHTAAVMLSSDIPFRKYVRNIFMDKALVSTSPTIEGVKAIDSFHEYAGVKWLQDKPLSKFEDSQWLFIQKAEEEQLLQVKIKLPEHDLNQLTKTCNDAYLKGGEGASTRLWNEQRKSILKDVISNLLMPSMEKEARKLLNAKAKNWVLMKYGKQLWNKVSVAPYQNSDNATQSAQGVMACCWGNGKPGTVFVMLDSRGELIDTMHAGSLTLRSQSIIDQQRRRNDKERVLKFLTIHQPRVIALGAANASCIRLKEDISEIISMMSTDDFQDVSQEIKGPPAVVMEDEGLPRLYEDSEISMSQLPRQHGIVKRAVALGRYLINPLAMVATLCGEKKEVESWKLTPLEKFLTRDEKLEMIEWVMTDITNQIGIDINLATKHDWLLSPLQFVSGLGPRKASIMHRELVRGTDVQNRKDFAKLGLNTKKVFCNAVGFLRVSCDDANYVDSVDSILDCTRIHPESYDLAEDLARAILRQDMLENPDGDAAQVNAIEYVQNNPKLLECFDLNEYADRLETEKGECKKLTLVDIKIELVHGFKDPRPPYEERTQDEVFNIITGETEDLLVEGKRVQATVRHVQSKQAFCLLDSGMAGILFKEDVLDETEDVSLTDKLHEGLVLTCKIKLIDKNRCRVHLTCKASELKDDGEQVLQDMDPYYCQGNVILPSQQEATEKKELGNKNFMPRKISHPHFQNITADQAKEFLADKAVGEYIFHPSSRGPCYLALSLKIFCGLYVHKDIVEGGKCHDIKGLLRLGKTLKIGDEVFEDIDKVIELYVNPLVVHLNAMINFRKFKKGSKAEVDELLKLEKEEFPSRIPYGIGISYEHPGTFILSYIRSTNPHHEFIAIHPKGFKFRKQIFNNAEQLVAYFQNHINDNVARANKSGGWRSNDVDHKQSSGHNDRGENSSGGYGDGRGRGRGRGRDFERGRGRGGRGRGRGFGPRSGSRDDCTGDFKDAGNFTSSNWGSSPSNVADDSVAAGKSWGVGGSGEGNQENSKGFGWGKGGQGDRVENSLGGGWDNVGTEHNNDGGDTGWAKANSSGWKDNIGSKSWGGSGPGEGSGGGNASNFGQQSSHEGGWGQGEGQGRGWDNSGTDNDNNDNNDDGGGTGWAKGNSNSGWKDNTGSKSWGDDSGGTGWAKGNSNSGWKDSTGNKSWGGSDPGEGSGGGGGWGEGDGHRQGRGRGRRGSQGDNQGRGRGRWGENSQEDGSDYGGRGGRGRGRRGGGRWGGNNHEGASDYGGSSSSSGGGGCFRCGEVGHMARDCSTEGGKYGGGNSGGGGGVCFRCGEVGHMARDCSVEGGKYGGGNSGGGTCFRCGEVGHMARDCSVEGGKNGGGGGGGGSGCFRCGEVGHLARDCSVEGGRYGGGNSGGGGGAGKNTCFKCGKPGHFARECMEASG